MKYTLHIEDFREINLLLKASSDDYERGFNTMTSTTNKMRNQYECRCESPERYHGDRVVFACRKIDSNNVIICGSQKKWRFFGELILCI